MNSLHKSFFCFIFFIIPIGLGAQWYNRHSLNLSYGYYHHFEMGGHIYFLDHFAAGLDYTQTKVKTGPAYYTPNNTGLFGSYHYLKNTYTGTQLLLGVTTHRLKKLDFDFMIGMNWISATEYSDFVLKENEYSHAEWVEATSTNSKGIGFVMRGNMMMEVSSRFGFNLSVEQQLNSIRNGFNVFLGFNIGIIQDYSIVKQKDEAKRKQIEAQKQRKLEKQKHK